MTVPEAVITVSGLFVHPIKSCRGIAVQSARVGRRGFEHDRRFMVVDEHGRAITAREEHRLVTVRVALSGDELSIVAPGLEELRVPAAPSDGRRREVEVWSSQCDAIVIDEAGRWFSELLKRSAALVYMPEDVERQVSPERASPGDIVGFADGYPFLLIGEGSLADLNARLEAPVDMRRFRPNIVVSGMTAFAEDELQRFRIGDVGFRAVKPCSRCVMVTVDPDTAEAGKQPLTALAGYRNGEDGVLFGMNLIHQGTGVVAVGDRLLAG